MPTQAEYNALLAKVKALESKRATEKAGRLSLSRSDKSGGLMLLGLRKFPVTFHDDEWNMILDKAEDIRAFIKTNPEPEKKAA